MKKLRSFLNSQTLNQLVDTAFDLKVLQTAFDTCTSDAIKQHCKVAKYESGCLTLITDDALWMSKVRYSEQNMIKDLQKRPVFSDITAIKCKMSLKRISTPPPTRKKIPLSPANKALIASTAKSISDESLKEQLLKLAK